MVPVEFLETLAKTGVHFMGTSHRKAGVKNVVKELQDGLMKYYNLPSDYLVVLGNGGATLLFDMIALGIVEKGGYRERFGISRRVGTPHHRAG